jgi:SnoaL-like domain
MLWLSDTSRKYVRRPDERHYASTVCCCNFRGMKKLAALVLIGAIAMGIASAQSRSPAWLTADPGFSAFLASFQKGIDAFLNGDPRLWKQNASQTERATIMGAWGAYERTWKQVGERYDWAAARFQPSGAHADFEYLSGGISGDLAYTVAIEHSTVHIVGQKEPATMQLRVTHVFGRENGVWKLLHRHADPLIAKTAPVDVIKP